MAKVTNKNSRRYHSSRAKAKSSKLSQKKRTARQVFALAKRSMLTVVILSMLVVILALLLIFFLKPEKVVKDKLTAISTDYYENYFYPQIAERAEKPLSEVMGYYTTHGFSQVTLRQLLLIDHERYGDATPTLTKYCDENSTYIIIFPDPPYGKTDYRIDYHYSCTF